MMLTTTDTVPQPYEVLGLVQIVTRTLKPLGNLAGVEREVDEGLNRLATKAKGADAVIGVSISELSNNLVVFTGTAIRYK